MLATIAKEPSSPVAAQLVDFCFDRIYCVPGSERLKSRTYSAELLECLKGVYPGQQFESNTCYLEIDEQIQSAIDGQLEEYGFVGDDLRALTLTLESVHTSPLLLRLQIWPLDPQRNGR